MLNTIATLLITSGLSAIQFTPGRVPASDQYTSKDIFAPVAQSLGLTIEDERGRPGEGFGGYSARLGYSLTQDHVAVRQGRYSLILSKYPSAAETLEQIVTHKGASASNLPRMVDISQAWKVEGYLLVDSLPPRPKSVLHWRGFIVDKGFLFEIQISTTAPLSFDSKGRVVRSSEGVYLPPLSPEHGALAKAILDEVYKRGKALKMWGVE